MQAYRRGDAWQRSGDNKHVVQLTASQLPEPNPTATTKCGQVLPRPGHAEARNRLTTACEPVYQNGISSATLAALLPLYILSATVVHANHTTDSSCSASAVVHMRQVQI